MTVAVEVPPEIVDQVRSVCLGLPEAYEEQAWVGTRWRIRKKTFAHILTVDSGWPPAYARAAGNDGPIIVLTFRLPGPECDALSKQGDPYFLPPWAPNIVGMVLEPDADWDEIEEFLTESYCILAPRKLAESVHRPAR